MNNLNRVACALSLVALANVIPAQGMFGRFGAKLDTLCSRISFGFKSRVPSVFNFSNNSAAVDRFGSSHRFISESGAPKNQQRVDMLNAVKNLPSFPGIKVRHEGSMPNYSSKKPDGTITASTNGTLCNYPQAKISLHHSGDHRLWITQDHNITKKHGYGTTPEEAIVTCAALRHLFNDGSLMKNAGSITVGNLVLDDNGNLPDGDIHSAVQAILVDYATPHWCGDSPETSLGEMEGLE